MIPAVSGQEGEAGLDRREAERLLQVDRGEVEHGEHAAGHREHRQVGARSASAMRKMPRRTSGAFERSSMKTKAVSRATAAMAMPIVSTESQP